MRDPQAEIWLASQRIEHELRDALRRSQVPAGPGWSVILRQRSGEALIGLGRRLLPAPSRATASAS